MNNRVEYTSLLKICSYVAAAVDSSFISFSPCLLHECILFVWKPRNAHFLLEINSLMLYVSCLFVKSTSQSLSTSANILVYPKLNTILSK